MKKGQHVWVKMFPDKLSERVVWKVEKTYVAVCRPEMFDQIKDLPGLPDLVMGFPKEDVKESP